MVASLRTAGAPFLYRNLSLLAGTPTARAPVLLSAASFTTNRKPAER